GRVCLGLVVLVCLRPVVFGEGCRVFLGRGDVGVRGPLLRLRGGRGRCGVRGLFWRVHSNRVLFRRCRREQDGREREQAEGEDTDKGGGDVAGPRSFPWLSSPAPGPRVPARCDPPLPIVSFRHATARSYTQSRTGYPA